MNELTPVVTATQTPTAASAWRPALLALALLLLVIVGLYRETAVAMVGIWSRSETFAHAFIVPPISLWLIWRLRGVLAAMAPRPTLWMLAPMTLMALMWLAGDLVVVNAVTQLAFVAMLVSAVPLVLGTHVARAIAFPLGFLFFSVPIGEFLLPVLMEGTADFTVAALRLTGIPVYREGLQFVIPSGNWSVVEACSGVRYLIASLMVGTLFAYLNYRSMTRRWIFVGISIVVPIVANWLRAYMIVMIGHLSDNRLAVGVDHLIYGWVFFGVVIMLMFTIGARWAEPDAIATVGANDETQARTSHRITGNGGWWAAGVVGAAVAALGPLSTAALTYRHSSALLSAWTLPADFGPKWASSEEFTPWRPLFQKPTLEVRGSYKGANGMVGVHIAQFRHQSYESKLVNSEHLLVKSEETAWNKQELPVVRLALGDAVSDLRAFRLQGAPSLARSEKPVLTVWQVYRVNGLLMTSDYLAKVHTALARLSGRGDDGASILLFTSDASGADASALLESFARENLPAISAQVDAAAQRP